MKKLFTFIVFTSICGVVFSQYQRLVLLEEFTQASCGPCASQNPGFNDLLNDNLDKATSIKYQVWWPGYDPMYLDNETDVNTRVDYYSVSGVPDALMDGTTIYNDCGYYSGAPACTDQSEIDDQYAVASPLLIEVSHTFSVDYSTINVHVDITAGSDVTGDLKLQVAVTERNLFWPAPPGSNGEMDFYNVMKKMLPDANGTSISSFTAGETKSFDFSWTLDYIYIMNELQVVGFVQDDDTKDILQSGISEPNMEFPDYELNADGADILCTGTTLAPSINLINNSDEELTSLDITYSVDGGTTNTYAWTGSILGGASADITLPEIDFESSGSHSVEVSFDTPDGNSFNNSASAITNVFEVTLASVEEGFEDSDFPPVNWGLVNNELSEGWVLIKTEGGYGESDNSAKADFYNVISGTFDLIAPKMDLTDYTTAISLTFDRAYAKDDISSHIDYLKVYASTDCGENWEEIFSANSSALETSDPKSTAYKPYDDEWATDAIDVTDYSGLENVIFKFSAISGAGNNLYLDNMRISNPVAIDNAGLVGGINIYPNPTSNIALMELSLVNANDLSIQITDVLGSVVSGLGSKHYFAGTQYIPVNVETLADGVYFVNIIGNGVNQTLKLNVAK
ncbi:MAG: Omp28-related outer membrane protein [Fimbriimonadaceae bacterium]|nr:Omp28-related outer membrane protein [Chitinophagales bacterium]